MTQSVYAYRNGLLCVEALPLCEIAQNVAPPFSCISAAQVERCVHASSAVFDGLDVSFSYDLDHDLPLAVAQLLSSCGLGVTTMDVKTLERAITADFKPESIMMMGRMKTRDDMVGALLTGVRQIGVISLDELARLNEVTRTIGKHASVSLLVSASLGTGEKNLPGFDFDSIVEALILLENSTHLSLTGLDLVLPWPSMEAPVLRQTYKTFALLAATLRVQGLEVNHLTLGGGARAMADYVQAALVAEMLSPLGCKITLRRDESLVHEAGVCIARVLSITTTKDKPLVVLDVGRGRGERAHAKGAKLAAMEALPLRITPSSQSSMMSCCLYGPSCDESDCLSTSASLPCDLKIGDGVVLMQTGCLNQQNLPVLLVSGVQYETIYHPKILADALLIEKFAQNVRAIHAA